MRLVLFGLSPVSNARQLSANPCGSEPARDSGGSVNIDAECSAVIASRLAPTGFLNIAGMRVFKSPEGYFLKATRSCAVAYAYARIRRLVRLGVAR